MEDFKLKDLIQELVDDGRQLLASSTKAMKFWYIIAYLALAVVYVVSPLIGCCISVLLSIFLLGVFLDGSEKYNLFWVQMSFLYWFVIIFLILMSSFITLGMFLYKNIILHFNNWLNRL